MGACSALFTLERRCTVLPCLPGVEMSCSGVYLRFADAPIYGSVTYSRRSFTPLYPLSSSVRLKTIEQTDAGAGVRRDARRVAMRMAHHSQSVVFDQVGFLVCVYFLVHGHSLWPPLLSRCLLRVFLHPSPAPIISTDSRSILPPSQVLR